jgi:hypothetical protein
MTWQCQCEAAGECSLLKRTMTPRQHAICQGQAEGLTAEECAAYRTLWLRIHRPELAVSLPPAKQSLDLSCPHRGDVLRTSECGSCTGKVLLKVHACELHDACTQSERAVAGAVNCPTCPDLPARIAATALAATTTPTPLNADLPFDGPITRNLIYHLGPWSGNGTWQRNIEQLRRRLHMFNGRRIATIITDPKFDPPAAVQEACKDVFDETIVLANNPNLREVVSFLPLWERIASTDRNTITFFAHAKGVRHPVNDGVTVHRWTEIQYETCLDYLPLVEERLRYFPLAGSFKKVGRHLGVPWHYSGTFYWLRHARIFSQPDWRRIQNKWWGTESWPGLHFPPESGGVLFFEGVGFDLYQFAYFQRVIEPAYAAWKKQHAERRSHHGAAR